MRRWILLGILVITATWGGWVLIQRHRQAVEREGPRQREAAWSMAYQQARTAFYTENYAMAEKLITDLLPDTEKSHAKDRYLAELLSMLGTSYSVEHKYDQAEPVLKRSLQVYGTISPADPLGTERTESNLASVYIDGEDYASAEPYLSDAVSLCEKNAGMPGYERGNALLKLGMVRLMQGRYPEAEQLLNRSVEALTPDSAPWAQTDLANAFYRLGGVYSMESRNAEAKQQFRKALEMREKLIGPNSREVGQTLLGLGEVYQAEGKYQESESLYKRAIDVYEKAGGPENPDLAEGLVALGCLYRDEQQFDIAKADPLLQRAVAIREKVLGPDHIITANTLSNLSLLSFYERKFGDAERFAQRALPIQEKAYGPESLEVATTLNRLGLAERDLKKLAQAETSLKRALRIREKNLPPNHTWIAISLENLGSVYLAQGEVEKAAPLMKRAQAIRSHAPAG